MKLSLQNGGVRVELPDDRIADSSDEDDVDHNDDYSNVVPIAPRMPTPPCCVLLLGCS